MPLLPGKENIGHNISELEATGRKHSQAVAIALREAGVPKKHMSHEGNGRHKREKRYV